MTAPTIRPKDRDAVIQSLRAGVVPRVGQHLVQVGRTREIETLVTDIERIVDGGSAFRVVVGEYGAGKTFFLNLVRAVAMEKKLVVASADLNPDRRLHASGGQARSLYADPTKHLLPDQGVMSFMEHCSKRIGDTYFRTPRTTITAFINLLAVLEQNPGAVWQDLLGGIDVAVDTGGAGDQEVETDDGDEFASFKM